MYKKIMNKLTNGNKPSWLTIVLAISAVVALFLSVTKVTDRFFNKGVGSAILAQTVSDNTEEIIEVADTLKKVERRIEQREEKFDKFLNQQTRRVLLDSVNNATLMKFLDAQIGFNEKQVEFNGIVKEHLIKSGND